MRSLDTQRLSTAKPDIDRAAAILRAGGLVAVPTETVYGLAADATQDHAVARIFEAKGRPRFNPLIVHAASTADAAHWADITPLARRLSTLWPGPLTLVLPLKPGTALAPLVTAGLDSVAIRIPAHPVARALLQALDGPIAAPSANPSGRISPVSADHVLAGLSGRIDAVIDAGACAVGVESTIIDARGDTAVLLRDGGISRDQIATTAGSLSVPDAPLQTSSGAAQITAPGQLASHYAPRGRVRLNADAPQDGEIWVRFGPGRGGATHDGLTLSESGDTTEAAARLFHILHQADALAGPDGLIAFAPIPETGLGQAVNDRLRRAAAPRD